MADEVLQQGVRGITDLMVMPGLINLDFADVRGVMREMGKAMMNTGEAEATVAHWKPRKGDRQPLLDGMSMAGARASSSRSRRRGHAPDGGRQAANHIRELVDPDANIIWGSAFNDNLDGRSIGRRDRYRRMGDNTVQAAPATRSFSFARGQPP